MISFRILKVPKFPGHNKVSPASYPDVFKAAAVRKRKPDGTLKDYHSTKEPNTPTDQEVEDVLAEPPFKKSDLQQLHYPSLQVIYGVTPDEVNRVLHSWKKVVANPVDQFALLVEGLNKLSAGRDTLVSRSNQEQPRNQSTSTS